MGKYLCPDVVLPSLLSLDEAWLRQRGVRGLLFDLDNTIVPRDSPVLDPPVAKRLGDLLAGGFRLAIVSNNGAARVAALAGELGVPFVSRAVKPLGSCFRRAMGLTGTTAAETAVVGDQIFTDVLGGNLLGLFTVLVRPLAGKEFIGTRLINRPLERLVLARLAGPDGPEGDFFDPDKR